MAQFDDTFNQERLAEIRREEEESLIKSLSLQYGIPYIDLRGVTLDPDAIKLLPEQTAHDGKMVIFEAVRKRVSVAMRNPNNPAAKIVLERLASEGKEVTPYMTSTNSLEHAWERYKDQKNTEAVKHGVLDIDIDNIAGQIEKFKTPADVTDQFCANRERLYV